MVMVITSTLENSGLVIYVTNSSIDFYCDMLASLSLIQPAERNI